MSVIIIISTSRYIQALHIFIVVILVDWIATFIQISIMNIQSLALNWFLMK